MTFLASVGSAAPFIGLFGTVWGIMNSFPAIAGVAEHQRSRSWRRASPRRCSRPRSAWSPPSRRCSPTTSSPAISSRYSNRLEAFAGEFWRHPRASSRTKH